MSSTLLVFIDPCASFRPRSLSDLKEIGCKSVWLVYISPLFRPIEQLLAFKILKICPHPAEVPVAISKAVEQAKKHLVKVPIKGGTIPHEVHGLFGAEHVLLKPAADGTGIIAGGAVRAVVELAGAHNIIAKTLGRGNPFNTVRATLNGLQQLRDPQEVMRLRRSPGVEAQVHI